MVLVKTACQLKQCGQKQRELTEIVRYLREKIFYMKSIRNNFAILIKKKDYFSLISIRYIVQFSNVDKKSFFCEIN